MKNPEGYERTAFQLRLQKTNCVQIHSAIASVLRIDHAGQNKAGRLDKCCIVATCLLSKFGWLHKRFFLEIRFDLTILPPGNLIFFNYFAFILQILSGTICALILKFRYSYMNLVLHHVRINVARCLVSKFGWFYKLFQKFDLILRSYRLAISSSSTILARLKLSREGNILGFVFKDNLF